MELPRLPAFKELIKMLWVTEEPWGDSRGSVALKVSNKPTCFKQFIPKPLYLKNSPAVSKAEFKCSERSQCPKNKEIIKIEQAFINRPAVRTLWSLYRNGIFTFATQLVHGGLSAMALWDPDTHKYDVPTCKNGDVKGSRLWGSI